MNRAMARLYYRCGGFVVIVVFVVFEKRKIVQMQNFASPQINPWLCKSNFKEDNPDNFGQHWGIGRDVACNISIPEIKNVMCDLRHSEVGC
jgi:hypothetical protein